MAVSIKRFVNTETDAAMRALLDEKTTPELRDLIAAIDALAKPQRGERWVRGIAKQIVWARERAVVAEMEKGMD